MTEFQAWYAGVREVLDSATDDAAIFVPVMWSVGRPQARFAWVDRRLRVWRTHDRNVLTYAGNLSAQTGKGGAMKVQVLDDDGKMIFEADSASADLPTLPPPQDRTAISMMLDTAAKIAGSNADVIASIRADIRATIGRIDAELGAHSAFTWAQTRLLNALAHLDHYMRGVWTEPPVVGGVTVDDRGVILSVQAPPAPPEDPDHARR